LAVVEELIKGMDGLIRAAKIRTNSGKTNRPIAKLFPLEVNECDGTSTSQEITDAVDHESLEDDTSSSTTPVHQRPMRSTASKARNLIKRWTGALSTAPEDIKN